MAISEFRVALTVDEFEQAVAFYRDGLGLVADQLWTNNGRGQMFLAGRASLEIFDPAYAAGVDQLEVGQRVSGRIRFAFQVDDVHAAVRRALEYGATLVREPTPTPWNDLNARVQSPEGQQITLYQTLRKDES